MSEPAQEVLGTRFESLEEDDAFYATPGAYRQMCVSTGADGGAEICWHVLCPNCCNPMLLGPKPPASGHFVKDEDDFTITCQLHPPEDPENSNSILCPCGWHGQIIRGLWKPM